MTVLCGDLSDIGAGAQGAAAFLDQRFEGVDDGGRAALGDRRARRFEGEGDHFSHLGGIGAFGGQPAMQHPRRPKRLGQRALVVRLQPAARGGERAAHPGRKPARAAFADLAEQQFGGGPRPQRTAKEREKEGRVLFDVAHIARVLVAVAGG